MEQAVPIGIGDPWGHVKAEYQKRPAAQPCLRLPVSKGCAKLR